jgi:hypothetical protein
MFYPNVILVLSTALITTTGNYPEKEKRIAQYCKGINQIADYIANTNSLKVIHVDNTINNISSIDEKIRLSLERFDNLVKFYKLQNSFGKLNKGAGTITQWKMIEEALSPFDYLIHYEPRQFFINFNFLNGFFSNPANYFRVDSFWDRKYLFSFFRHAQVQTGLFSLRSEVLIKFIHQVNLSEMVNDSICIESLLYKYLKNNNIKYKIVKELGVLWNNEPSNYIKM